jgi:Nif-specific regulatory protein
MHETEKLWRDASLRSPRELALLLEISQALSRNLNLQETLGAVPRLIAEKMGLLRCTVTILNRDRGESVIDEAYGLSREERQRGRYSVGEGITGQVVQTGKPVVVPRISDEPRFLDKTRTRRKQLKEQQDISFICVPIMVEREVTGTLSVDRLFDEAVSGEEDLRLLSIVAAMIAQAVRLRQGSLERCQALEAENARLQDELESRFRPANLVGNSHAMRKVLALVPRVAPSTTTVLIRGESGVGKELIAQCIHYNSPRAAKPFIKVNCAALPESVIESELFGHERGAFTGAVAQRKGRFELADSGSIFLDEIGDISPATQVKLLRVLQEREFERVGGDRPIKVDVRIIAATNRNVEQLIQDGRFREDLYYRLNVFPLFVPPLRERRTDILLLADHFVETLARQAGKDVKRISTPAIDMLTAYHWPGNVRELQNCIERAVLLSTDGVIHGHHLPPSLQTAEASGTEPAGKLQAVLEGVERELLVDTLKSTRGNMAGAARRLGLTERIMGLRVKYYNLDLHRFKQA